MIVKLTTTDEELVALMGLAAEELCRKQTMPIEEEITVMSAAAYCAHRIVEHLTDVDPFDTRLVDIMTRINKKVMAMTEKLEKIIKEGVDEWLEEEEKNEM